MRQAVKCQETFGLDGQGEQPSAPRGHIKGVWHCHLVHSLSAYMLWRFSHLAPIMSLRFCALLQNNESSAGSCGGRLGPNMLASATLETAHQTVQGLLLADQTLDRRKNHRHTKRSKGRRPARAHNPLLGSGSAAVEGCGAAVGRENRNG